MRGIYIYIISRVSNCFIILRKPAYLKRRKREREREKKESVRKKKRLVKKERKRERVRERFISLKLEQSLLTILTIKGIN